MIQNCKWADFGETVGQLLCLIIFGTKWDRDKLIFSAE